MQSAPPPPEEQSVLGEINESIRNIKDIRKFIDVSKFSIPETLADAKHNAQLNFETFKGNYILIICVCTLVFLIREVLSIPLVVLWACYFYFTPRGSETRRIGGVTLDKRRCLAATVIVSIVYCIVFRNILLNMMVTFSIAMFLVVGHMIAYKADDNSPL